MACNNLHNNYIESLRYEETILACLPVYKSTPSEQSVHYRSWAPTEGVKFTAPEYTREPI